MSHDRVAPSRVDTGRPVRVWVYDAKTSQERDVMYMAPEFSGQNGGPSYYRIPVVLLFCIAHVGQDENGRDQFVPTVLRTYGKLPYMYVRAPEAWQNTNGVPPSDEDLERVRHRLDDAIWEKIKQGRAGGQRKMEDDKNEDTVSGEKRGRKEVKRSKALGTGKASLKQANFSFAPTKRSHDRRENEEEEAEVAKPVRDQASEEARLEQQYNESCNEFACGIEERVAEARGDEELQRQVTLAINMEWEQLKLEYQCALENLAEEFGSMEPMVSSSNTVDPAPVDENDAQPFGWYDNSGQTTSSGRRREPYVHSVEFVHKPTTHHFDEAKSYLRVTLTSPNLVTSLRSLLWTPVAVGSTPTNVIHQENKRPPSISFKDGQGKVHALPQDDLAECKVEFYMRYLIDQKLDMCAWLEVNNAEHMDEELVEGNTSTAFLAARHNDIRVLDEKSVKMPPPQFLEVGMDIETRNTVIWGDEEYNDDQGHKRSRKYVRGAKFPNAQTPDNSVQCICLSIHPHGEAMTASAAERRKCVSEGLNWDDRDGDRKTILKRQRDAEMGGGWYEVFYWGDVNEQKVTNARSEKPIKFHQARDELCMLRMFRDCLAALRAEIPLTWNGNAFDVPYIYDRLKTHYGNKSSDVFNVADMVGATSDWQAKREEWRAEHARFQSAQAGKRGGRDIIWSGMPWRDVMQEVIRNYKFRSYKLDWVAEHFLGEHKDDMDPALITPKWDSGPDGAAEVVSYCCWDAELPWRISQVNRLTENLLQMACVTMVPPQALLTRGQSIKSYIQVLKIAAERGFLVHHHEAPPNAFDSKRGEAKYKGAVVIEPIKGFYKRAVIVLDFSSLYPKEAISHNLCYTTWVPPWKLDEVPEEDRIQTPAGHWFVKPHVRRGLVPEILKRLLAQRSLTRSAGTKAEADGDMITATSLDTRQLQYKVSANSMYGFMGSDASLPCFAVSESITAYGRQDILATKDTIESRYPGYRVIYGDTDSVMIATPEDERMEDTLAKLAAVTEAPAAVSSTIRDDPELLSAFRRLYGENASEDQVLAEQIGPRELLTQVFEMASRVHAIDTMHKMAKLVNESFREDNESVMEITAEKVYTNYLLLSKKRYSAMFWTKPERPDKHDSKGLENVRRDFAPITSEAVDGVLKRIVRDGDVEAAIHYACEVIGQVVSGDIDFNKLIISKKFSRPEKDYTAPQPHIHTNKKVKRRDPGREKLEGDRIEYVITSGPEKTYERAEDPRYVLENNVQVDYKYYYEKQLLEPLHRLFKRVLPEHRIQSEIFNGPHMRRRKAAPIRKDEGGIGRFVVATKRSYDDSTSTDANNANACKEQHAKDSQQQPRLVLTALPTRPTLRNNTESLTRVMRTMSTDERNVALEESFKASAVASVVAHNPFSRNRRRRTTTARSRKSSSTAAKRKKTAATTKLVKRSFTVEEMANVPRVPMPQPDVLHPFVLMADCDNDDLIDQHQDKRLCTQQTDEEMTDYI